MHDIFNIHAETLMPCSQYVALDTDQLAHSYYHLTYITVKMKYWIPTYFSCTLAIIADLPQLHNASITGSYHATAAVMTRICHLGVESNAVDYRVKVWTHPRLIPSN